MTMHELLLRRAELHRQLKAINEEIRAARRNRSRTHDDNMAEKRKADLAVRNALVTEILARYNIR